ncbi:hypothetical protein [Fluviicola sp.]|uniref:hypothetical protein n=1 Tax=Fluviicola sp. TaxID=1917219 RepID=UPI003D2DAC0D
MKKALLALLLLSGFTLVSCKKDHTCACAMVRIDDNGNRNTSSDGNYSFKDTRLRAEKKCADLEETGTDIWGDYSRECDIK